MTVRPAVPTNVSWDGEVGEVGSRENLAGRRIQGEVKRHVPKTYLFIESHVLLVCPFCPDDSLPPNQTQLIKRTLKHG